MSVGLNADRRRSAHHLSWRAMARVVFPLLAQSRCLARQVRRFPVGHSLGEYGEAKKLGLNSPGFAEDRVLR